ncbi:MAG: hypothetical protein P9L91_01025, partial [Candidatus Zophobacter franzmannii]|nr:hypothetical protein [Candidatus Zophobacter franzmannii]
RYYLPVDNAEDSVDKTPYTSMTYFTLLLSSEACVPQSSLIASWHLQAKLTLFKNTSKMLVLRFQHLKSC